MSVEIETVFRRPAQSSRTLLALVRVCADGLRRYLRRRATARALAHLNEEELKDIGLIRTPRGYRELHQDRIGAFYWDD